MHVWITIFGLLAVCLVGFALGGTAEPLPYLYLAALAGMITALWPLTEPVRLGLKAWLDRPGGRWVLELGILALFVGVVAAMFPAQALGDRPIDHDHTVHFFRAWQLRDFLGDGRFFGWSHRWFAGYPVQYLYPIGADFWVLAVWALGLGFWTLDTAYGLAFVLFWALQGWSTYLAGRALLNRWAGLLGGLFVILDTGSFRFGGWVFAGEWGVWPNSLAIAFGMLATAQLPGLWHRRDRAPMVWFAIWTALAMVTHPLHLVHMVALIGGSTLSLLTSDREGSRLLGVTRMVFSGGLGVALSMPWLLGFLSTRDQADNYGAPWRNAYDMGVQLYSGKLLEGSWMLAATLALLGTTALLRHRRTAPSTVALMAMLCAAGASSWFIANFHLPSLSESFSFLQFQRFAMILKPYAFLTAGAALVAIFGTVARRTEPSALRSLVVILFGVPILFGWVDTLRFDQLSRNLREESSRPYREARRALAQWLTEDWNARDVPFYRVQTDFTYHDHTFVDLGTQIPMPVYKTGYTPAENFRLKMESDAPEMLKALNVRYVVTAGRLSARYKLIKDFGQGLKLYEYLDWAKDPFVVQGKGVVSLEEWSDERIVLKASGGAEGTLRLNVSHFPRWHASRDGVDLEIRPVSLPSDKRTGFMSVELRDGLYVFEFRQAWPEKLGALLGILALIVLVLLAVSGRRKHGLGVAEVPVLHALGVLADADTTYDSQLRVLGALGVVACAAGLTALAVWTPPIDGVDGIHDIRYDLRGKLSQARVARGSKVCPQVLGRHLCTREEYGQVYNTVAEFDGQMRECIWAHPYTKSTLTLEYPQVPAGRLVGWFGVADSGEGRAPVNFKVSQSGKVVFEGQTSEDGKRERFVAPAQPGSMTVEITAANQGKRHFCFAAQVVNEDASAP